MWIPSAYWYLLTTARLETHHPLCKRSILLSLSRRYPEYVILPPATVCCIPHQINSQSVRHICGNERFCGNSVELRSTCSTRSIYYASEILHTYVYMHTVHASDNLPVCCASLVPCGCGDWNWPSATTMMKPLLSTLIIGETYSRHLLLSAISIYFWQFIHQSGEQVCWNGCFCIEGNRVGY